MAGSGLGKRTRTRALVVQALYQSRIAQHDCEELLAQFATRDEYRRVDAEWFRVLLEAVFRERDALAGYISRFADRPVEQIDPVELGILELGLVELAESAETPYRVVINEAVTLAKRYGAEDGHKYVNALLDRAARELRAAERPAARA